MSARKMALFFVFNFASCLVGSWIGVRLANGCPVWPW